SKSRHDLQLEASAPLAAGRAAGCARVLQIEQNRQAGADDEGLARPDFRARPDSGGTGYEGVRNLRRSSAGADLGIPDTASSARPDPARSADAVAERGAVRQSQRRHTAALEIGTEQS